ncbi:MAG: TetR/AcrR family transcriptional regulator [Bacilli bacterium]|jgi:AcrR family transcriptional regulator|nr:TetR/AcrR family transcriptional regulator [Bacilli bacterium]
MKAFFYERRHEETAERILSVAKKLLLKRGFNDVTVETIAKKAGISRQRLYCYFHGLDEVIYRIQIKNMDAFMCHLKEQLSENKDGSASSRLQNLIDGIFLYQEKHSDDFIFTSDFDSYYRIKKGNETLKEEYERSFQNNEFIESMFSLIQDGITEKEFSSALNPQAASLLWTNLFQLFLERLSIFTVNDEKHSEDELNLLKSEMVKAVFAYLK